MSVIHGTGAIYGGHKGQVSLVYKGFHRGLGKSRKQRKAACPLRATVAISTACSKWDLFVDS